MSSSKNALISAIAKQMARNDGWDFDESMDFQSSQNPRCRGYFNAAQEIAEYIYRHFKITPRGRAQRPLPRVGQRRF